jgi:hypothetical protein
VSENVWEKPNNKNVLFQSSPLHYYIVSSDDGKVMGKTRKYQNNDVLSASEISQYAYCSYSWFLQRCGYKAQSPFLEPGKETHIALGEKIDGFQTRMRYARWYAILGFVALCIGFLFLLLGVV